jgi:hypothetical protein
MNSHFDASHHDQIDGSSKNKKRSKISNQLRKSEIKDQDDKHFLLPDEIQVNVIVKNINENILLKKIVISVNELSKPFEIIRESISIFNKMFEFERLNIRFIDFDFTFFNLKPCKKNGLPNYDLPCKNATLFYRY